MKGTESWDVGERVSILTKVEKKDVYMTRKYLSKDLSKNEGVSNADIWHMWIFPHTEQ